MNWGFIGFGNIAPKFLKSLKVFENERVFAVATKSGKNSVKHLCPEALIYDDYQKLAEDPNIDIVYISTTHNFHVTQVLLCLKNNKHVICEKPMGMCAEDIRTIRAYPRSSFLMEAMWTRFLPAYKKLKILIEENLIGDIHFITANFAFDHPGKPEGRHLNPDLGGGALYDIGIYPLALALDLARHQWPIKKSAMALFSEGGIDINISFALAFPNGIVAQLFCAFDRNGNNNAVICGSTGTLIMKDFWKCQKIEHITNEDSYTYYLPFIETGYYHEIEEAITNINEGKLESSLMSLEHSEMISTMMEELLFIAREND